MTIAVISMIRVPWGGSEELWAAMANDALKQGHKVIHLSYDCKTVHPKMQALIDKGVVSYTRPTYMPLFKNSILETAHRAFFFLQKRMNNAVGRIIKLNPDIILYNGTCYSIAGEKQLLRNLPKSKGHFFILGHFNNEHGGDLPPRSVENIQKAYAKSKKVFFITARSINNAKRHLAVNIPNALVVGNPVNIDSTELIPFPKNDITQFAMVGNLMVIHKGQDIGLEVLASEKWKLRHWHLNIYGSGDDEAHLKKLVNFYGLANRVTFHGRVDNIREVWRVNQLLLMPSHMEGMPLAVVEAMICGRPVVVTDVGGHREWVEEGLQGFIAEASTVSSFGKALERAWAAKENWPTIGKNAHEKANTLYDPNPGKTLLRLLTSE
jgi:glycosyltransferase involved in cell wall biosynthesis